MAGALNAPAGARRARTRRMPAALVLAVGLAPAFAAPEAAAFSTRGPEGWIATAVDARPASAASSAVSAGSRGEAAPSEATRAADSDWAPSTQLSYVLTGNHFGPLHGSADVHWVREGDRYRVHVDVRVGLSFAPLLRRQLTSEGALGPEGLVPSRFEEKTKRPFTEEQRQVVRFDDEAVVLANGHRHPRPPGMQDGASQFVQLTWLFSTQPHRLKVGETMEVPLALLRELDHWVFDVAALETLDSPMGALQAFHLKPRRVPRPGGELTAQVWIAPSLQYLPVRIVIHQDTETFIDLMIKRAPAPARER
jgi:hypothetical protein